MAPRLPLSYDLNAEIPEFTSVLNHNTLPTIHNTELIRLSTRWFQRKQSSSKESVLLKKSWNDSWQGPILDRPALIPIITPQLKYLEYLVKT
ncbi:hypothetical protein QL285_009426 [Trifolium repens]|nr:hypothetical protein QL285_009426 [Trifolium repens]